MRAPGFAEFQETNFELGAGSPGELEIRLKMEVQLQKVDVLDDTTAPRGAASLTLSSADLEQLPLDGAALLDQIRSLAGGPQAELFVDGFSYAKLPPRSQIREVRINQDPYSAQNDINPLSGVIQVFTRPGTDSLHGEFYVQGDTSALDARNPFTPDQPSYYAFATENTISGTIRQNASYVATYSETEDRLNSLVNASALAVGSPLSPQAVASPVSIINLSSRLDLQPAPRSTFNIRYALDRNHQRNDGVGQLTLASQGYEAAAYTHTVQVSNSQVLGEHEVDDTRLQYIRQQSTRTPVSVAPALVVEGVFNGGGNPAGAVSEHVDKVELQNYLALSRGPHYINLGGRLRVSRDVNRSTAGFNGLFIFSSLSDYQRTIGGGTGQAAGGATGQAAEFIRTVGNPEAVVSVADMALFAQDAWKTTANLTLSYGLRVESQSFIPDHIDFAPRVGFSLALGRSRSGGTPRYTLHGGAGLFYRRFPLESALTVVREDGRSEQQIVVENPGFYSDVPDLASLGVAAAPSIYGVSQRYQSPYYISSTATLDRQIGRKAMLSLSWLSNRGVHTELIENVNAPAPGTYDPSRVNSGLRPLGTNQDVYEFSSDGLYRSNRFSATFNMRPGRYSLYGYYTARFDSSDAEPGSFPSLPNNVRADYGRANDDIRHTMTARGAADLVHGFSLSGFVHATSGAPFNITVGRDLNGDTQFNDRPAYATDLSRPGVITTLWGSFDTDPQPGQTIIPRNLGNGPAYVLVDVAVGKSFGVGPSHTPPAASGPVAEGSKAAAARWGTLDFSLEAENLLNHPNLTMPIGTLGSPLFGRSLAVSSATSLSGDRILNLTAVFRF